MTKSTQDNNTDETKAATHFSETVKESAQQIWLAGLGAFSKAQQEGGKVFENLVKEGSAMQRKTQSAAEEKIAEASSKWSSVASDIQAKAGTQWDKLEGIFEARVAKALTNLRVASADEVAALKAQVEALTRKVHRNSRVAAANSEAGSEANATQPSARRPAPRQSDAE